MLLYKACHKKEGPYHILDYGMVHIVTYNVGALKTRLLLGTHALLFTKLITITGVSQQRLRNFAIDDVTYVLHATQMIMFNYYIV